MQQTVIIRAEDHMRDNLNKDDTVTHVTQVYCSALPMPSGSANNNTARLNLC